MSSPLRKTRVLIEDLLLSSIIRQSIESSIEIFDTHQEAIFFFSVVLALVGSIGDSHLVEG